MSIAMLSISANIAFAHSNPFISTYYKNIFPLSIRPSARFLQGGNSRCIAANPLDRGGSIFGKPWHFRVCIEFLRGTGDYYDGEQQRTMREMGPVHFHFSDSDITSSVLCPCISEDKGECFSGFPADGSRWPGEVEGFKRFPADGSPPCDGDGHGKSRGRVSGGYFGRGPEQWYILMDFVSGMSFFAYGGGGWLCLGTLWKKSYPIGIIRHCILGYRIVMTN